MLLEIRIRYEYYISNVYIIINYSQTILANIVFCILYFSYSGVASITDEPSQTFRSYIFALKFKNKNVPVHLKKATYNNETIRNIYDSFI